VQVKIRMIGQELLNALSFVAGEVIEHNVDFLAD
jgi:hypothetical protein